MKTAAVCVPSIDEYPWKSILAGLDRAGFKVNPARHHAKDADILVTWSPWAGSFRALIDAHYRERGCPVIVVENGWLGPIGGTTFYQVALDGWNGTGRFPAGTMARWKSWELGLSPWRPPMGGGALVIGQRGHPTDPRTCIPRWHELVQIDHPNVRRRPRDSDIPLVAEAFGAEVGHVWTSSAASHLLCWGIPVVQHGPNLMVSELTSRPGEPLREPDNRVEVFAKLSGAQWTAEEIATGQPFARLLEIA